MKLIKNCCFILGIFLLLFQKSLAQRGYNYARPGLGAATGSGNVGSGSIPPTAPLNNALRPIIPTGNGATAPGYATAPTAFGAPAATQGATAFGTFATQPQRALSPTVATNAFGIAGGSTAGVLARPTATQRTAGGLFGTNLGRAQTTQFSSGAGTGGIGGTGGTGTGASYESEGDYSAIPGVPGIDYPLYSQVPTTSFDCAQQALPGYYSDVEAQCQVFHICALNRTYSFLCPNGTIFSQEVLVCVWWNQYDCASAPTLYANNAFIYDYGSRVTPTDATGGYQVGGGTVRPQSNFPLATNTARTSSSSGTATAQTAGIFGNSLALRSTVTTGGGGSGGYGGFTTAITPAPTATYGNRLSSGRLASATPTPQQTFQNAAAVIPATPIGSIGPTGPAGIGVPGGVSLQTNALQTAQLATSSANREYLPPAQRS